MAIIDDSLRTQLGNAYTSGDYSGLNNLLSQNKITSDQLASSFSLSNSDLGFAKSLGINAYTPPGTSTPPSLATTTTDPARTQTQQNSISPAISPSPDLRTQIGNAYQNNDIAGMNNLINQNNLDSNWFQQNFGLQQGDFNTAKGMGINIANSPAPVNPATSQVPPVQTDPNQLTPDTMKSLQSINMTGVGGNAFYTAPDGTVYQPIMSGGGNGGENESGSPTLQGYAVYDPNHQEEGDPFKMYDQNGKLISNNVFASENGWKDFAVFAISAVAMAFGIPAMMEAGAAGAGTAGTTFGVVDSTVTLPSAATALSGATPGLGLQATAGPGLQLASATGAPGLTAAAGPGLTLAAPTGGLGLSAEIAGNVLTGGLTDGLAGGSGTLLGPNGLAGTVQMADGTFLQNPSLLPGASFPSLPSTPPVPGGGAGTNAPPGTDDLAKTINKVATTGGTLNDIIRGVAQVAAGAKDASAQRGAANDMLAWLKSQQAKIDGLYAPGSPEYNLLKQQMEAQDAAAGRNSQYGVRAVDLAAKIAQIKAQYTAQLTQGIAGNMSAAFNQNASADSGLAATIGKVLGGSSSGGLDVGGLINKGLNTIFN